MSSGGKGGGEVTVGYHYYLNVHFALCHSGVDEIVKVKVGDRVAWSGSQVGAGTLVINQPNLFGGESREGGVVGLVDFMPGDSSQPVNPSLEWAVRKELGGSLNVPAYRGITSVFFKGFAGPDTVGTPWDIVVSSDQNPGQLPNSFSGFFNFIASYVVTGLMSAVAGSSFYWSAMNPYFKSPEFQIRRTWKGWYPAKATLNGDVNPAHVIYESLTNFEWGLGLSVTRIDTTSFTAAADTFYDEGMMISIKWNGQDKVEDFIQIVLDHASAVLIENRSTGLFELRPVRGGYTVASLPILDETNCEVTEFQRKPMGETVNEVVVEYTERDSGDLNTVTVQDLANFSSQGVINSQKLSFPGISSADLAVKVGQRELNVLSRPIASMTIRIPNYQSDIYPGDIFRVSWSRYGLSDFVVRVARVRGSEYGNPEVVIDVLEDVFAEPYTSVTGVQPPIWVDSVSYPSPVVNYRIENVSYWELYTKTSSADRLDWSPDTEFVRVLADAPNNDSKSLTLYDVNESSEIATGGFAKRMVLLQDIDTNAGLITVDYLNTDRFALYVGQMCLIGDEMVEIQALNADGSLSIRRGLVDTIPANHAAGTSVWAYDSATSVSDRTLRVGLESVTYKLLPSTSLDKLDPSAAANVGYTVEQRQIAPYRPGNVRINGSVLPAAVTGDTDFVVSWSHRDRTQELLTSPVDYTDGDIGPEPGVTYNLSLYDQDGALIGSYTGLTGTSHTYSMSTELTDVGVTSSGGSGVFVLVPTSGGAGSVIPGSPLVNRSIRVTLESVRDGYTSWQTYDLTVDRAGYGYAYGEYYGGP